MADIEKALEIAINAHKGDTDKGGEAYILHPLRMLCGLDTTEEKMVALLHDVVEDSGYSLETLEGEGFSSAVLNAVECLTKKEGEEYEDFIERVSHNTLASRVKMEDLKDNLDVNRLSELTEKDRDRLNKYKKALKKLRGVE